MYHSCDSVAVHRLIEVKRLTDQIKHYRIQQKKGISLMAESLHHHGNIIAQKSQGGKWCVCVSLHVACAYKWL